MQSKTQEEGASSTSSFAPQRHSATVPQCHSAQEPECANALRQPLSSNEQVYKSEHCPCPQFAPGRSTRSITRISTNVCVAFSSNPS